MPEPLARTCAACAADLVRDEHRPDCAALRRTDIGGPPWRVLRLSRRLRLSQLEEALELANRRARAWLAVRGRSFP